ncbi:MAG: rhomboid family protein [Fibrobacteres bacterium]|nr:rhomboid family protein [Fibrobacterota bacterium]
MDDSPLPIDDSAPTAPPRHALEHSARKDEIMDYSLVLASQGIKHWMEFDGAEWSLTVDDAEAPLAKDLIETYRAENRGFQDAPPEERNLDLLLSPLLFLAVPVACYFLVGLSPWANWWHSRGSADAKLILEGQWWRCITAATLHADEEHFLSNLVSGYFILNLLNHRLGVGTVMLLATLGAGLANWLVALASGVNHVSIGFSSVVFCALGMLAAVETLNRPHSRAKGTSGWIAGLRRVTPILAAFFVAVYVGLGENADVKAHFYGFGIGAVLGLLTRFAPGSLKRPAWQGTLVLSTWILYSLTWWLALRT